MESFPSNSMVKRSCLVLLRVLTSVCLLIALIIIAVTSQTVGGAKFKFNDVHSFSIVSRDSQFKGNGVYIFNFYADKVISYLLMSGAAAGFGASQDVHRIFDDTLNLNLDDFFAKANASASLLLIAFLCSAIASIFSSYELPR
ncbi:CASP-like protein 4D1 isoform X2 [Prosopis cineraria]|uniref:CASP-like protein 4D1 isoform X2 n=1 Tax=Prosopis cineraria TaxID=364024 RepID=UPI00240FA829|nr:CASP-like protein 4D1 isoform X2 [Prosopis cineraria]